MFPQNHLQMLQIPLRWKLQFMQSGTILVLFSITYNKNDLKTSQDVGKIDAVQSKKSGDEPDQPD